MGSRTNNLQDFRKQVELYLDNALSSNDEKELMSKVNDDPNCGRVLDTERNFRSFIKNNVKRPQVSPDFIQNLKNKVRVERD